MPAPFDSHSRNFGELLGQYEKRRVVVPQFQRGYSWERTHVATFWSDLTDFKSRLPASSARLENRDLIENEQGRFLAPTE